MENKALGNEENKKASNTTDNEQKYYPGYKPYPANEDIMRAANNNGKEELDEENIGVPNALDMPGQEHITPAPAARPADAPDAEDEDEDVKIVMGTEADVTKEDLQMLEDADQNFDTQDDINLQEARLDETDEDGDPLNEAGMGSDVSGKDLDIPGSDLDDPDEALGEEDEENNHYSLGGDEHENLDEDNYNS